MPPNSQKPSSDDNWRVRTGDPTPSAFLRTPTTSKPPRAPSGSSTRGSGRGGSRSRTTSTRSSRSDDPTTSTISQDKPLQQQQSTLPEKPPPPPPSAPVASTRQQRHQPKATVPTVVVEGSTPTEPSIPSQGPSRSTNRRKRSQQGHPRPPASAALPAKGSFPPPPPNPKPPTNKKSNLNNRHNLPNPPHTAPLPKETPKLQQDVRSNIDAAVERMRAVALGDNRPSTPGSHIDWARDDDDESLPDLDDWGITPTANSSPGRLPPNSDDTEAISPLIVEGLKTLPEPIAAKLPASSPDKVSLPSLHIPPAEPSNTIIDRSSRSRSHSPREPSPLKTSGRNPPRSTGRTNNNNNNKGRSTDNKQTSSRSRPKGPNSQSDSTPTVDDGNKAAAPPIPTTVSSSRLPPKPSFLPPKPTATAELPVRDAKAGASPMRSSVPLPPRSPSDKTFPPPQQQQSQSAVDRSVVEQDAEPPKTDLVVVVDNGSIVTKNRSQDQGSKNHASSPTATLKKAVDNGLKASMHAPPSSKDPSPSPEHPIKSAPALLQSSSPSDHCPSSYPPNTVDTNDLSSLVPNSGPPQRANNNNNNAYPLPGVPSWAHDSPPLMGGGGSSKPHPHRQQRHHSTRSANPRLPNPSGMTMATTSTSTATAMPHHPSDQKQYHSRAQSSPPATGPHAQRYHNKNNSVNHHRSPLTARPVITGDAISRLARTIGGLGPNGSSGGSVKPVDKSPE